MNLPTSKVTITLFRLGKPARTYTEGLIADDGAQLRTHSVIPEEFRARWSINWRREGMIPDDCTIYSVRKHLFYRQYFAIMSLFDEHSRLLGYYCDIVTPLRKIGDHYRLTDLCLDLWIFPDRKVRQLDWDEFEQAVRAGFLNTKVESIARRTVARLAAEAAAGVFPARYIE